MTRHQERRPLSRLIQAESPGEGSGWCRSRLSVGLHCQDRLGDSGAGQAVLLIMACTTLA